MKADVRIIVSNKTLWQQVFGWAMSEYLPIVSIEVHFPILVEIPWHSYQLLDTVIVNP